MDIGKTASNDFAKHFCLFGRRTIEARLMREFEADAVFTNPAYRAFDGAILAEVKLDPVPQLRLERAADHRAAAGEIDQLDGPLLTLVGEADLLIEETVAVLVPAIRPVPIFARDDDAAQLFGFCAPGLLLADQHRLIVVAEDLRPDIHCPLRPGGAIIGELWLRKRAPMLLKQQKLGGHAMPMGDSGRWEGRPPPASLKQPAFGRLPYDE